MKWPTIEQIRSFTDLPYGYSWDYLKREEINVATDFFRTWFPSISVGLASPAMADDFSGKYALNLIGSSAHTSWTARTTCPPSSQCVAHITSSSGWSGDARLAGGRWTMTVDRPNGHSCPDGTRGAELQTWSWDATTLVGQVSGVSAESATCPVGPANDFTLSKAAAGVVTPV